MLVGLQNDIDSLEVSLAVCYRTKHILTIRFANGTAYTKELKIYAQTKPVHQCLYQLFFIIAKTCKHPRCASISK